MGNLKLESDSKMLWISLAQMGSVIPDMDDVCNPISYIINHF